MDIPPTTADVPPGEYLLVEYLGARVVDRTPVTVTDRSDGDAIGTAAASGASIDQVATFVARSGRRLSYMSNDTVDIWVTATNTNPFPGRPVADVNVTVTVNRPDGGQDVFQVNTGSDGTAAVPYSNTSSLGRYRVSVSTSDSSDFTSTRRTTFFVGPVTDFTTGFGHLTPIGDPVNASVRTLAGYQPVNGSQEDIRITRPDGTSVTRTTVTDSSGFGDVSFTPTQGGLYRVSLEGSTTASQRRIVATDLVAQTSVNGRQFAEVAPGKRVAITGAVREDGQPVPNRDITVGIYNETSRQYVERISTTMTADGLFQVTWSVPSDTTGFSSFDIRLFADRQRIGTEGAGIYVYPSEEPEDGPSISIESTEFRELPGTDIETRAVAPGESAVFRATLRDSDGNPLADEPVRFTAQYGFEFPFRSRTVRTNGSGVAEVTLTLPSNAPHPTDFRVDAVATHNRTSVRDITQRPIQTYAWDGEYGEESLLVGQTHTYTISGVEIATGDPAVDQPVTTRFGLVGTATDTIGHAAGRTGADGRVSFSVAAPSRPTPYRLSAASIAPDRRPGRYEFAYVNPFAVDIDVSNETVDPGDTVSFDFTTGVAGSQTGFVTLSAGATEGTTQRLLLSGPLTAGETASVRIPAGADAGTTYVVRVLVATDDGRVASGYAGIEVTGSDTGGAITVPNDYASIQAAVDNASDGDTVAVRPGVYTESVTLTSNVTLVAPSGATLRKDSTVTESAAIRIGDPSTPAEPTAPTIEGFRIQGWQYGVYDYNEAGAWTLRDTVIDGAEAGIVATDSTGAWTAEDVTITDARLAVNALDSAGAWRLDRVRVVNATEGITAGRSTGNWVARDVTIRNASNVGVDAPRTTGDWTLRNVTVESAERYGINAEEAAGNWTVAESTIRDVARYYGIGAVNTTGAWTVRDTTITSTGDDGVAAANSAGDWRLDGLTIHGVGGDAVDAAGTEGRWTIRRSTVRNASGTGVAATDAAIAGTATRNYWGAADGPSGDFPGSGEAAVGNVSVEPFYTDPGLTTLETFGGGADLVVNRSDSDAYDSIQVAVDDASDGDTIEVRPGTYTESVVIRENVTLLAPDGATVKNGSAHSRAGILVLGPVTPTVSGFTIAGWRAGFSAGASEGAWTLRDTVIRDGDLGIGAAGTPAPWTVTNVTVVNTTTGLSAYESSGDWTVRRSTFRRTGGISSDRSSGDWTVERTTIRNTTDGEALNAARSSGRWTVENATFVDNRNSVSADESTGRWTVRDSVIENTTDDGVNAEVTNGAWTLDNVTIRHTGDQAVEADDASGDWTIRDTVVVGTDDDGVHAEDTGGNWTLDGVTVQETGGDAVDVSRADGQWTIQQSVLRNATGAGVAADGATKGNATHNYWGAADGPSGDFPGSGEAAVGNVSVRPFYVDAALTTLSSAPGPSFTATALEMPADVSVGDTVVVRTTIANTGGSGEGTVELRVDTSGDTTLESGETRARRSLQLDAGETVSLSFTFGTDALDPGTHAVGVVTANDTRQDELAVSPSVDIPRLPRGAGGGRGTGDPHLVTFDGVSYDFQAVGEYVFAREPNGALNVQTRLVPVGDRQVSVISAVATSVDGHTVTIDARDETPVSVDDAGRSLNASDWITVGNGTVYRQGRTYVVVFPGDDGRVDDGDEQLRAQVRRGRVDVRLVLDESRSSSVEGLLGSPDGNASNDLVLADGTPLDRPLSYDQLYGPYRADYRVGATTSLFDYDDGEGPETFYNASFPAEIVTVADLDPAARQEAAERAREAGLESGTAEFEDAVLDYALTGDSSYIGSSRRAANDTEVVEDATPPGSVRFDDTSVANGSTVVTVDRASFTAGAYYLVLHREQTPGDGERNLTAPVGVSSRLAEGTHTGVTVDLGRSLSADDGLDALTTDETLVAVAHRADVQNQTFGERITTGDGLVADEAALTVTSNRPPSVEASLRSTVNNAGSAVEITVTATDPDGVVDTIRLRSPRETDTETETVTRTCQQRKCQITLSVTPTSSTWNGGGYATRAFTVSVTDDANGTARTTVSTKLYIAGDATGDGTVNIFDAVAVGRAWEATRGDAAYSDAADLTNDGVVNIFDAVAIGRNWQERA